MKKHFNKILMLVAILIGLSLTGSAQIYVKVRPVRPVIVRSASPSPHHVWVDEDWEERDGKYAWVGGHWVAPPHPGWAWVPGHWKRGPRGERWVRGHWRKA